MQRLSASKGRLAWLTACSVLLLAGAAGAQPPDGNFDGARYGRYRPDYGGDWGFRGPGTRPQHPTDHTIPGYRGKHDFRQPQSSFSYNSGYFQRPYPFHLDYYREKYNGSYEPYFGNLYGPPSFNMFVPTPIRPFGGAFYW